MQRRPRGFYNEGEMVRRYLNGLDSGFVFEDTPSVTISDIESYYSAKPEVKEEEKMVLKEETEEKIEQALHPPEKPVNVSVRPQNVHYTKKVEAEKTTPMQRLQQALPPPVNVTVQPQNLHYTYIPPQKPSRHRTQAPRRRKQKKRAVWTIFISQKVVQNVENENSTSSTTKVVYAY